MLSDHNFISLRDLSYRSVLPRLRAEAPDRIEESVLRGERVQIARVADMFYLPDRGLQILEGRIVPRESLLDLSGLASIKLDRVRDDRPLVHRLSDFEYRDDEVCVLSNSGSSVFYHWLEELYKVVILENHGFDGRYVVSGMPDFATEFLELLGIAGERILLDVSEPTVFRSALLTTLVFHRAAAAHRGVFSALRDAILAADVSREPLLGERLWIYRGRQTTQKRRDIVNSGEVEECLNLHGFTAVDMAELSVRRQIAAVRNTAVLGGPHGSGLVHSMFLKERSAVIECFSPHYINPCAIGICRNLQHRYFQIVSRNTLSDPHPYAAHLDIDCDHLRLVLQNLGPSPSPVRPSASRPNPSSRQTYDDALLAHRARIASELARIESRIECAHNGEPDQDVVTTLLTMRVVLCSGLFDPDCYLAAYNDVRDAASDPLEHYVTRGDRENRKPNPNFDPMFYRLVNPEVPPDRNALEHYIEEGERAGLMPNWNFDPGAYLVANPALSEYVDRPLFHYLRIGKAAEMRVA
jgi:hypothetical protein